MADMSTPHIERAKGFWSEFKRFALKGNALELAFAVIIGNGFSQIVNSLVGDIITPLLGLVTGNGQTDFKNLSLVLRAAQTGNGTTTPELALHYGQFIQTIFNFFIIALSIFIVFKLLSSARERFFANEEKEKPKEKKPEERLLEEIRDILRSGRDDSPRA